VKRKEKRELLIQFKNKVNSIHVLQLTDKDIDSFLSTLPEEKEENIMSVIDEVSELHPYKKPGDRLSYSEYNEGWTDACDALKDRLTPHTNKP